MAIRNNPCKTELKTARSQRNRLQTISEKLAEMACKWEGSVAGSKREARRWLRL